MQAELLRQIEESRERLNLSPAEIRQLAHEVVQGVNWPVRDLAELNCERLQKFLDVMEALECSEAISAKGIGEPVSVHRWHIATVGDLIDMEARIRTQLNRIEGKEDNIMKELDTLTADVAAETTVEKSAITLLQGLKAQLDAAGTDPVKLAALSTQIESNTSALAAAVAANTPATV